MAVATEYPAVLLFDGKTTYPDVDGVLRLLPVVQQGTYWQGFRVRLLNGASPETTLSPLAQIRTAPVDRGGTLVCEMDATDDGNGWWHFDLSQEVTTVMPLRLLPFDVDLTDDDGHNRTPIVGKVLVVGEVSRG